MAEFREKLQTVQAIQWDGTLEGAKRVSNFMKSIDRDVDMTVHTAIDRASDDADAVAWNSRLEFHRFFEAHIRESDWVVLKEDGSLAVMLNGHFARTYAPVEHTVSS